MKRVRDKRIISITLILTFLAFAVTSIQASTPPPDHVKVYVRNPFTGTNTFPTKPYPQTTMMEVWIDSPLAWRNTASGIVGVTMSLRFDPTVVEPLGAMQYPDTDWDGTSNGFLGQFLSDFGYNWLGYGLFFTGGTIDKSSGTFTGTAEVILGYTTLGVGAGAGPYPLWRYIFRTNASVLDYTTAYSAINIFNAYYTTVDGAKHPIDIVDNGHYGTPPPQFYMNHVGSLLPSGDPIGSTWHELYPNYSHMWSLDSWIDNGDGNLSPSDQIDMTNETGWIFDFHVDVVTVTIHWTFKPDGITPDPTQLGAAEAPEQTELVITDPIGTAWHQVYPDYSREFVITSWIDNNGNGFFDPSDQFDFEYFGEGITYWAHLDDVTTDIILSQKGEPTPPPIPEFPLGLGLMIAMAPAIPIVYLWRTRKKVGTK